MFSGRSLICSKNNKGPSAEPWGTPELTRISDELSPSSSIVWERPVRKAFIQDRVLPLAPCWWSLYNSSRWFTLSNALLKSSMIMSFCRPWEVLRAISSTSWISWVSKTSFHRNHVGGHTGYYFVQNVGVYKCIHSLLDCARPNIQNHATVCVAF